MDLVFPFCLFVRSLVVSHVPPTNPVGGIIGERDDVIFLCCEVDRGSARSWRVSSGTNTNPPNPTTPLHLHRGGALQLVFLVWHDGRVTERLIVGIHIERTRGTEPPEGDFVVLLFRREGDGRPLDGR